MSEPHTQDEATWPEREVDVAAAPPAPANQWTEHDGGIEPAPPGSTSTTRALQRMTNWFRSVFARSPQ